MPSRLRTVRPEMQAETTMKVMMCMVLLLCKKNRGNTRKPGEAPGLGLSNAIRHKTRCCLFSETSYLTYSRRATKMIQI